MTKHTEITTRTTDEGRRTLSTSTVRRPRHLSAKGETMAISNAEYWTSQSLRRVYGFESRGYDEEGEPTSLAIQLEGDGPEDVALIEILTGDFTIEAAEKNSVASAIADQVCQRWNDARCLHGFRLRTSCIECCPEPNPSAEALAKAVEAFFRNRDRSVDARIPEEEMRKALDVYLGKAGR